MVYIFLDTNIFLEFKPFYEVPWKKIVNDNFKILVPLVVLNELDKHKVGNNRKKIERAKKATKKIEAFIDNGDLYPNLELIYYHPEDNYFTDNGFDKQQQDDRLLATILSYTDKNPENQIILISYDTGVRLRAKQIGLNILKMPEEYLLPAELDEATKQIDKLNKELLLIKNQAPKIVLTFDNRQDFIEAAITENKLLIDKEFHNLKQRFPTYLTKSLPKEIKSNNVHEIIDNFSIRHAALTDDQITLYNQELDDYKEKYDIYLDKWRIYKEMKDCTVILNIVLNNEGSSPGNDIDIKFHFPDGFELYDRSSYPSEPKKPKEPYRPKNRFDFKFANSYYPDLDFRPHNTPSVNVYSGPSIKKTNSYDVRYNINQLKHHHSHSLETLLVVFENYRMAKSFPIDYEITLSNHPTKIMGNLNVKII
jgi:hypothetical protein